MKRAARNLELFKDKVPRQFGGSAMKSHAKKARPLSTKHAVHLILKAGMAHGKRSLLHPKNAKVVDAIIRKHAKKFGLRLYHLVNVGNHVHLVLALPQLALPAAKKAYFAFVRTVSGLIARHVLSAQKGSPQGRKFWQGLPFTRLASWGRDYRQLGRYMEKNQADALSIMIDSGSDIIAAGHGRRTNSS